MAPLAPANMARHWTGFTGRAMPVWGDGPMGVASDIGAALRAKAAALAGRDPHRLAALIDPDFVYVNAMGRRFDRAAYVDTYGGGGPVRFLAQEVEDLEVRDLDGFAIATMRLRDRFEHEGGTFAGSFRSFCVFRRTAAGWLWCGGQTMAAGARDP
ncbi:MAG: nuclear transport factor 2 family protein [Alphaproteobacteria bacterium]